MGFALLVNIAVSNSQSSHSTSCRRTPLMASLDYVAKITFHEMLLHADVLTSFRKDKVSSMT